jgi:non-specific serine/threonine protein kinase
MSVPFENPFTSASAPGRRLGRYELRARLGRSQRSVLWNVLDVSAGVERWLVLPCTPPMSAPARAAWIADAKHAARIQHPMLAPMLEIGQQDGWPYAVFERGNAVTLPEWIAAHGALSHVDAARWLGDVLQALAFAHDAGLAHHDLQRCFVAVGDGAARLIGLGTTALRAPAAPSELEQRRDMRDAAQRDVWSVGVLAYTLLAGRDALDEPDIGIVLERLAKRGGERVRLPRVTPQPLPGPLRSIVDRASANEQRLRYRSARVLREALDGWREAFERADAGPVARLVERLASIGHLPAMPGAEGRTAQLMKMERGRTQELAELVLQDFGLGLELLRQVNTAQVRTTQAAGNGAVLTVRRAIALLGVAAVAQSAATLRRWPGPLDAAGATALRTLIEHVRLAGRVAVRIRPAGYDAEVVFIVALLQNLARLMLAYHFAEANAQMRELMQDAPPERAGEPAQPGLGEDDAASAVLGAEMDAFANAAARHFGFDDSVLHVIRRLNPALRCAPRRPTTT